jgi:dTMP kinase
MEPHGYPGKKIDFEGRNGSGKSTQARMAQQLYSDAVLTKEPYTRTPDGRPVHLGDEIYQVLKGEHSRTRLAHMTTAQFQRYFYFPNRTQHCLDVVIPSLERGKLVLSDRGLASVCYGAANIGELHGLMAHQLEMFYALRLPWPDAIIIYDVPSEVVIARMAQRGEKLDEQERQEANDVVRRNYLAFAKAWPNCHVVDAGGSPHDVFVKTQEIIASVLGRP